MERNLKHCPQDSRRTAYLSLVRSTLEYSSIVWDPYLQKDTDKLEKVQRRAARFITGNYTSRDQGCVSQMLAELNLPPLQDRRKANRLTFFFKVVEGLVPAMQSHDFLTPVRGKRLIKSKQYTDCVTSNIIDKQSTNNSKCFNLSGIRRGSGVERRSSDSEPHTNVVRVRASPAPKYFLSGDALIWPYVCGLAVAGRIRWFHRHIPGCRDMSWLSSTSRQPCA